MSTPHDDLAHFIFSQLRRAAEALTAALGPTIAPLIDWDSLRAAPTNLVDQARGKRLPDLCFAVKLRELTALVQIVFEHQSTVDRLMPVRFFFHTSALWNAVRQEASQTVPLVLNVLLHSGPHPWNTSVELADVIDGGAYLRDQAPELLPHLPIYVDDLAAISDEVLRARRLSSDLTLGMLVLKHGRDGEAVRALQEAPDLLASASEDVIRELVRYVLRVDVEAGVESVSAALAEPLGSPGKEIAVTVGERLIAEGEAKGLKQGLRQGLKQGVARGVAKGVAKGKAQAILRLLARQGLRPTAAQEKRLLSCMDEAQLDTWLDQAVSAGTLDDVFGARRAPARRPKPH